MSYDSKCITATGRRFSTICGVLAILFLGVSIHLSSAQPSSPQSQIMKPPEEGGAGSPQVVNGMLEKSEVWPATLKYYVDNWFSCTSTIVGDRVVITAAHCLVPEATMHVQFKEGEAPFNLECQAHPRFQREDLLADVALCLSDRRFETGEGFRFENLDLKISRLRPNSRVYLLGYGCRRFEDVKDPSKAGVLYGGVSIVNKLPLGTGDHILLKGSNGGAVICPGDSGGAGYLLAANDKREGPRSIVGINSGYRADDRISALTALVGPVAEFIRDWAADWNVTICGVHAGATNCREKYTP